MNSTKQPFITDRSSAPKLRAIDQISFLAPAIHKLNNYVKLFWTNGIQNQTSKIELHFAAGSTTADPLCASLCAGLLINGTAKKSAKQIQSALDAVGAYYDVSLTQDNAIVTLYALKDQLLKAYEIFHESLFAAVFPAKEVRELAHERAQKFKIQPKDSFSAAFLMGPSTPDKFSLQISRMQTAAQSKFFTSNITSKAYKKFFSLAISLSRTSKT